MCPARVKESFNSSTPPHMIPSLLSILGWSRGCWSVCWGISLGVADGSAAPGVTQGSIQTSLWISDEPPWRIGSKRAHTLRHVATPLMLCYLQLIEAWMFQTPNPLPWPLTWPPLSPCPLTQNPLTQQRWLAQLVKGVVVYNVNSQLINSHKDSVMFALIPSAVKCTD